MLARLANYYTYIAVSIAIAGLFVYDYSCVYREFFPTVVALTNSNAFNIVILNAAVCVLMLMFTVIRFIFFGALRPTERILLREQLFFHVLETFIGISYHQINVTYPTYAMLIFTSGLKMLHLLAEARSEHLGTSETIPKLEKVRQLSFLSAVFVIDIILAGYIFNVLSIVSMPMYVLQLLELNHMVMIVFSIVLRRGIIELARFFDFQRDNVSATLFMLEVVLNVVRSAQFIVCVALMYAKSDFPFYLMRPLSQHIQKGVNSFRHMVKYVRMALNIDHHFEDATPVDLDRDRRCAICYDEMEDETRCKRLPCGHCYHRFCLRRWFEKQSSCPYCRMELDRSAARPPVPAPVTPAAAAAPPPPPAPPQPATFAEAPSGSVDPPPDWASAAPRLRCLAAQVPQLHLISREFDEDLAFTILMELFHAEGPLGRQPRELASEAQTALLFWFHDPPQQDASVGQSASASDTSTASISEEERDRQAEYQCMCTVQRQLRAELGFPVDALRSHLFETELFLRFPHLGLVLMGELLHRMEQNLGPKWSTRREALWPQALNKSRTSVSGASISTHPRRAHFNALLRTAVGDEEDRVIGFSLNRDVLLGMADDVTDESSSSNSSCGGTSSPGAQEATGEATDLVDVKQAMAAVPAPPPVVVTATQATSSTAEFHPSVSVEDAHPPLEGARAVGEPLPPPLPLTRTPVTDPATSGGPPKLPTDSEVTAPGTDFVMRTAERRAAAFRAFEAEVAAASERLQRALSEAEGGT